MSLARLAMRIAAARALRGTTLAEARVYDSAIAPIDQTIAEERQPILIKLSISASTSALSRSFWLWIMQADIAS